MCGAIKSGALVEQVPRFGDWRFKVFARVRAPPLRPTGKEARMATAEDDFMVAVLEKIAASLGAVSPPRAEEPTVYMTLPEVVRYTGLSREVIETWAMDRRNPPPGFRSGRNWKFYRPELDAWLKSHHGQIV